MDFNNLGDKVSNLILQILGIALVSLLLCGCYWLCEDIQLKKLNMRVMFED